MGEGIAAVMRLGLVAFALISVTPAPATAANDWWYIGSILQSSNRIAYFADAGEPANNAAYKPIWIELVFESEVSRGETKTRSLLV